MANIFRTISAIFCFCRRCDKKHLVCFLVCSLIVFKECKPLSRLTVNIDVSSYLILEFLAVTFPSQYMPRRPNSGILHTCYFHCMHAKHLRFGKESKNRSRTLITDKIFKNLTYNLKSHFFQKVDAY